MAVVALAPPVLHNNTMAIDQVHRAGYQKLNADTSRGTPKTLTLDVLRPAQLEPLSAPQRLWPVTDTSWGTPKTLTDVALQLRGPTFSTLHRLPSVWNTSQGFTPPATLLPPAPIAQTASAPLLLWRPSDTSTGFTPPSTVSNVQVRGPTFATLHRLPAVVDTSRGYTPLTVIAPALPGNLSFQSPDRIRSVTDTSQGTNFSLLALVPPPIIPPEMLAAPAYQHRYADTTRGFSPLDPVGAKQTASAPERTRYLSDTSKSAMPPAAPAPLVNPPGYAVDRVRPVTDTSQSTPKTLYADLLAPFRNAQQTTPDRIRPVANTSQSLGNGLLPAAVFPIPIGQAAPLNAPRLLFQPADTSQSIAKALYADGTQTRFSTFAMLHRLPSVLDTSRGFTPTVTVAPFTPTQYLAVEKPRQIVDTSQSSSIVLQAVVAQTTQTRQPLFFQIDRIRPVIDTSQSTPKTLFGDDVGPLNVVWGGSVEYPRAAFGTVNSGVTPPAVVVSTDQVRQPTYTLRDRIRPVWDTSRGVPEQLMPAQQAIPIGQSTPLNAPRLLWKPADTSQSIPVAFQAVVVVQIRSATFGLLDKTRPVYDTTRGTPVELYPVGVVSPPIVNVAQPSLPRLAWQNADTSQSSPKATFGDDVGPLNVVWGGFLSQPPQTLADQQFFTSNIPAAVVVSTDQIRPPTFTLRDKIRPVFDTSRGTPVELFAPPAPPVVNQPWFGADRQRPVVDTSQSTPKALYADTRLPFQNYQHTAPDRVRPVTDTSRGYQQPISPPAPPFGSANWPSPISPPWVLRNQVFSTSAIRVLFTAWSPVTPIENPGWGPVTPSAGAGWGPVVPGASLSWGPITDANGVTWAPIVTASGVIWTQVNSTFQAPTGSVE